MSPSEVTLELALRLLSLPRVLGRDPATGQELSAGLGRYGPFVRRAKDYRNLESLELAFDISLDDALRLLSQEKPARRRTRRVLRPLGPHPDSGAQVDLLEGRYGPYVSDGKTNASIPRGRDPLTISMDEAAELLAVASARKKARRPRRRSRAGARRGTS